VIRAQKESQLLKTQNTDMLTRVQDLEHDLRRKDLESQDSLAELERQIISKFKNTAQDKYDLAASSFQSKASDYEREILSLKTRSDTSLKTANELQRINQDLNAQMTAISGQKNEISISCSKLRLDLEFSDKTLERITVERSDIQSKIESMEKLFRGNQMSYQDENTKLTNQLNLVSNSFRDATKKEKIGSILIEELKAESERLAERLAAQSTNLHEVSIERDHLISARDELRIEVSTLEKKVIGHEENLFQIGGT
jgi:chromosome segregation ATPase